MTYTLEIAYHGACIEYRTNLSAREVREILAQYPEDEFDSYIELETEEV